jgi:hypothetical protein
MCVAELRGGCIPVRERPKDIQGHNNDYTPGQLCSRVCRVFPDIGVDTVTTSAEGAMSSAVRFPILMRRRIIRR